MALSEYDKQFAEAMAVKLKLNRQQNSKTSTTSVESNEPSAPTREIPNRESIMDSVIARNPSLTREELSKDMEEMGF
jgi:MinD superfamily P-loop ATPase